MKQYLFIAGKWFYERVIQLPWKNSKRLDRIEQKINSICLKIDILMKLIRKEDASILSRRDSNADN